jgi:hypothetical protein
MIFHPKGEYIAALLASKTVKRLPFRIHGKGRILFCMKGAKAYKISSSLSELHELTDQIHNVGGPSDLFPWRH